MPDYDYDIFVIGAGSGGVRLSRVAASMGARVAVAEDRYLGGTCVNVGCVPKKLFVYASEANGHLHESAGFGWQLEGQFKFNWKTLLSNKNNEIQRLNGIYKTLLEDSDVTLINGRARIKDRHHVVINNNAFSAKHIVIATGSWPVMPDFNGVEHAISSNEFFYMDQLPKSATVMGGGYIAVEMAGILNGLGVETTLVYRGDLILRGFDNEIREFVQSELIKKGIKIKLHDQIESMALDGDGSFELIMRSGEKYTTGLVLCATGRQPHTNDIGLDHVNITTNKKGEIAVDESFQTTEETIYALGDVTGGMQLTPVALAEGMALAQHLCANKPVTLNYQCIPTAVFCQPNIGTVGVTEEQARTLYNKVRIYTSEFRPLKHTLSGGQERCLMKLIVDAASDKVVGVHMVGHEAGEIIQGIAIAIKAGATKQNFDETIGIHPTSAEEFVSMRSISRY